MPLANNNKTAYLSCKMYALCDKKIEMSSTLKKVKLEFNPMKVI